MTGASHARSRRAFATCCVVVVSVAGGGCVAVTAQRPSAEHQVDASAERQLQGLVPFGFSGAALIMQNDSVVHTGGYGFSDWQSRKLNTPTTIFDIGSLSKQFTAAAVMALVEDGLLSVQDSIGKYIPDVPPDKRGITVHHLLAHTSGLPPFHSFRDTITGVHGDFVEMSREQAERIIVRRPLDFAPGEGWTYSNSGYTLLAAIVERVGGRPFEDVLRTELFAPAGLERTGLYFQLATNGADVAHGYRGSEHQGTPFDWTETKELWGLIGNGGVASTLTDLGRWHRALHNGSVLSKQSVDRLFSQQAEVRNGLHYGYGWYVEQQDSTRHIIRHGGANDFGFAARWRWHPAEDLLTVLLVNRHPPGMEVDIAANAVERALDIAAKGGRSDALPAARIASRSADLDRYAGRYVVEGGGELIVRPTIGGVAVEPIGPTPTMRLAFPDASQSEQTAIDQLNQRARAIVDGMVQGDYKPLADAMGNSPSVSRFQNSIAEWWKEFADAGANRDHVAVMGTVPIWWAVGDDRLATIVTARIGDDDGAFRLHWRDGRLVGLGGGAIREPATTVFVPAEDGGFVGYHLGIQRPVALSFHEEAAGQISGLTIRDGTWSLTARRQAN